MEDGHAVMSTLSTSNRDLSDLFPFHVLNKVKQSNAILGFHLFADQGVKFYFGLELFCVFAFGFSLIRIKSTTSSTT